MAWKPIRPTAADVKTISPELAKAILVHDETGAKLCGWKPK